ncbi:MAG: ATPase [Euryarchaeota archaeon]|nr:ATPase [Euryarchaeota archaeon]
MNPLYETDEKVSYDRFNLKRNPFSRLSSEGIKDIDTIHVSQDIDSKISGMLSEVINKKSSVAFSLIGDLGSGKTQRLKGIHRLLEKAGFSIYIKIDTNNTIKIIKDIFSVFYYLKEDEKSDFEKFKDKFDRFLGKELEFDEIWHLQKGKFKSTEMGDELKKYISEFELPCLILDEVENLVSAPEQELISFFEVLRQFISDMPSSSLFIMASTKEGAEKIKNSNPAFYMRLHRTLEVEPLTNEKALELVEKRLVTERIDNEKDLNPIYPFEESGVEYVNKMVNGNPRLLLRMLHTIITSAVKDELIEVIDDRYISDLLSTPSSIEEYILKVPQELRDLVKLIIRKFNGGPVSYIEIAKETRMNPTVIYENLKELAGMGLMNNERGKFEVAPGIREMLEKSEEKKS